MDSRFWPVTAYLSTNSRCTYDIEDGKFFIFALAPNPLAYAAHELLHFYTHYALRPELLARGLTEAAYNDIKEALTELLNIEFADILGDARDAGYPQHADLRACIRTNWPIHRDLKTMVNALIELRENQPRGLATKKL